MSSHPYRESAAPRTVASSKSAGVARDDVVVALLLLVVGMLEVLSGVSMGRQTHLTLGLVLLAFAIKVAWDARGSRR